MAGFLLKRVSSSFYKILLKKQNRLLKTKDFNLVFQKGRFVSNHFFLLKYAINSLYLNRFGFVVSSKVSNKAVVRNKIKRRLREIIRKEINSIPSSYDIVIVAKKTAVGLDFKDFKKAVIGLTGKI